MTTWQQLLAQVRTVWQGLSLTGRLLMVGGLAAAFAVLFGVLYWAAQPDYRLLFGNLTPQSAAAVTEALERLGVRYKVGADGTSIYVPGDKVHELRLKLAAEGVADGGVKGFELFDESPFGMTPFMEQVNYLRALQAELARTISQLEPVAAARVHITRPEPSPFVREQKPPTASVVLKLRPGATLGPGVVRGITALVAGSVEGLSPNNVTVLDTTGRVLAGPRDEESFLSASLLEYRRNLEEYLARKAEEMLTELLGPGRAVVKVSAEVDLTQQELTREQYDPDNKVVRTESITNKKETRGSRAVPRGVPGVASNVPGAAGAGATNAPGGLSQEETITNEYLVSKTVSRTLNHAGQIKRLTVAVLVDLPATEDGQPAITVQDVEKVVRTAVGIQEARGDELTVSEADLASARMRQALQQELAAAQRWERYMTLARTASLVIASLMAFGTIWLVVRRFLPPAPAGPPEQKAAATAAAGTAPDRSAHPMPVLAENIERDPDAVAKVLERWLREEEEAVA